MALSNIQHAEAKARADRECFRQILCFRPPGSDPRRDVGALIQMPQGVGNMRLLRSDPFPTTGIEGPGGHRDEPLFTVIVQPKSSLTQFLGKTGPHLYGGGNCGDDIKSAELHVRPPEDGRIFNLEVCTAVPDLDYPVPRFLKTQSKGEVAVRTDMLQVVGPYDVNRLDETYVWVQGQTLVSHGVAAAAKEGVEFNVFKTKYIMFVDALTGVVSPGGVDCVTNTHIPIRAEFSQGTHPGQWRVGGEASFGWGGKCQFCTSSVGSAIKVTKPFDVLCYKPLLPTDLKSIKKEIRVAPLRHLFPPKQSRLGAEGRAPPKPMVCFMKTMRRKDGNEFRTAFQGAFIGSQVVTSALFPAAGCRPNSKKMDLHIALGRSGTQRLLGACTRSSDSYGRSGMSTEFFGLESSTPGLSPHFEEMDGLYVCMVVPQSEFHHYKDSRFQHPLEHYIYVDAISMLATAAELTEDPAASAYPYDAISSFIMFADALTGVVSPGGVDCVTNTHIPIRAEVGKGGMYPGQWRVGGEASFGWGGKCHMCTSHQGGDCTVIIPFDILCHKPSLPTGCRLQHSKKSGKYFMSVGEGGIMEMDEEEDTEEEEDEETDDSYSVDDDDY